MTETARKLNLAIQSLLAKLATLCRLAIGSIPTVDAVITRFSPETQKGRTKKSPHERRLRRKGIYREAYNGCTFKKAMFVIWNVGAKLLANTPRRRYTGGKCKQCVGFLLVRHPLKKRAK